MMRQEKVLRFFVRWRELQPATIKLDVAIEASLKELGYGE